MTGYFARRVAGLLVVLVASSVLVFGFLHIAPGGPVTLLLAGRPATKETVDGINRQYGLDRPLPIQYVAWASHAARGDFGESIKERDSVSNVVMPRLRITVALTAYAATLILLFGVPLGVLGAAFRTRGADVGASLLTLALGSIPVYITGVVLILIFSVQFKLLPAYGSGSGAAGELEHLTLPAIALSLSAVALVSRTTRMAMTESLRSEYVEAARIRGLSERRVLVKHALRSALVPVITIGGVVIGYLLSGAILIEYVFGIDGVGLLLVRSVQSLDYPVVQAIALILTTEFLVINLVVDLLYRVIDPRLRIAANEMSA